MSDTLAITYDGPRAEITLTRPDVHNRFDAVLHADFITALAEVRHRGDVRSLVLASTGATFSAGGDFELMRALHDDPRLRQASIDEGRRLLGDLIDMPIPIVTALQGDAIDIPSRANDRSRTSPARCCSDRFSARLVPWTARGGRAAIRAARARAAGRTSSAVSTRSVTRPMP